MNDRQEVIQKNFEELTAQYQGLALTKLEDDTWLISGVLEFSATYKDIKIKDRFQIEITISKNFPDMPPIVKETGGRIPKDFHTNPDGTLCLGAPIDVRIKFADNQSLLGFVNDQVIPFLYAYSYFVQYGVMPFDELSHGSKGILEYYKNYFNTSSDVIVMELLKILAESSYKGHRECPCKSGRSIRECHGSLIRKINLAQYKGEFLLDYVHCFIYLKNSGHEMPKSLYSKKIMNRIKEHTKALNKNEKRGVGAGQAQN